MLANGPIAFPMELITTCKPEGKERDDELRVQLAPCNGTVI